MRILACVPLAFDATSYYRAFGIFPNLRRQLDYELRIDSYVGRNWTWAELASYDVLFMQRPANPEWLKLAEYCKNLGIKIWVDHDDNLFELPPYNRVYDTYSTDKSKQCMLDIMKLADVVTVSTEALKTYFAGLQVEATVIPNALNDELTKPVTKYNEIKNGVEEIVWRGSETHLADFFFFQNEIADAMDKRANTNWTFMGYNPWFITMFTQSKSWKYVMSEDIMIYTEKLKKLAPQIMHVPLVMDGLNACKSNIAWIEATAAGAICIAPDWPEWQRPGILNYNTQDEYLVRLMVMLNPEFAANKWQQSMDYINENLLLSKVNKMRVAVLEKLRPKKPRSVMVDGEFVNEHVAKEIKKSFSNLPETMIE